jgi:hypothetical protein
MDNLLVHRINIYYLQFLFQLCSIMPSKCSSKLPWSRSLSAWIRLQDHSLTVYIIAYNILTSQYISKLACSWPQSIFGYSQHANTLICPWVHSFTAFRCISKHTYLMKSSASLSSHDYGHQAHLHSHSITASTLTLSWPPTAHQNLLYHSLWVHLKAHSAVSSKHICNFTQLHCSGAAWITLPNFLQWVRIYHL